jgi:N-acetylmuramoyl-L-alanine amidase
MALKQYLASSTTLILAAMFGVTAWGQSVERDPGAESSHPPVSIEQVSADAVLPSGGLSGKTIFISPGHGWIDYGGATGWSTQRGITHDLVEDFVHAESSSQYLLTYLRNAGAIVFTVRESDLNSNMIIVDDADGESHPGNGTYTETGDPGSFADTGEAGFANFSSPYGSATNPFLDTGGSSRSITTGPTETARATWAPVLPESGYYTVYISYSTIGAALANDAHYIVNHAGGQTSFRIDQETRGQTWIPLDRFYFEAGYNPTTGSVELVNDSTDLPGEAVTCDAVRFGGGLGDVFGENVGTSSGRPRWEEGARIYAQFMGAPSTVYGGGDVTARPKFAAWLNETGEDSIFLSLHSNSFNGTTRGTTSFVYSANAPGGTYDPTQSVAGSAELMNLIHDEIINDIRGAWEPTWTDRGYQSAYYGEINPANNDEMPSALFQVAFHDNASDAAALAEPRFRQILARAIYQGVVKYFADRDAEPIYLLPEPPEAVAVRSNSTDSITVSWQPPATDASGILGHAADSYVVYLSSTGRGFDDGTETSSTELTLSSLVPGAIYYVRIAARNAGGESFPSEVLAVRALGPRSPKALLVNGFDRLDRFQLVTVPEPLLGGSVKRMLLDRMNRFDYLIEHAEALRPLSVAFDSTSNEALLGGGSTISTYQAVFWALGQESTADETLSDAEQQLIAAFLVAGGDLFISGSELGWDLDSNGSSSDQAFFRDHMKADYVQDDAGVYEAIGAAGSVFSAITSIRFDDGTHGYYDVSYPDGIIPRTGAQACASYTGPPLDGCVMSTTGSSKVVYFGFPFETIYEASTRASVMSAAVGFLDVDPADFIFADGLESGDTSAWY